MENKISQQKHSKTKIVALIGAITVLAATVVPIIASIVKTPTITASDHSMAAGRDINITAHLPEHWRRGIELIFSKSTESNTEKSKSKQLEFDFQTIEVAPAPHQPANTSIHATVGLKIKNTGNNAIRLALVPPWPAAQIEGGLHFKSDFNDATGVAMSQSSNTYKCNAEASNFTLIRPGQTALVSILLRSSLGGREMPQSKSGRISGTLMIQSEGNKNCWIESIGGSQIQVITYK
jgi:hypothetical protein